MHSDRSSFGETNVQFIASLDMLALVIWGLMVIAVTVAGLHNCT